LTGVFLCGREAAYQMVNRPNGIPRQHPASVPESPRPGSRGGP